MKITAKLSIVMSAIFAAICFGVVITGWASMSEISDPVERSDAWGFMGFWAFLGTIALAFGALGVWVVRTQKEG